MKEKTGIFKNLTIIELATVLAGPSVGAFFAELGAKVIKIEHPAGGDVTRKWTVKGEEVSDGVSAYFSAVNWGKKSVAIDLSVPEGRERVYKMAEEADILLANFKDSSAKKLKMDGPTFQRKNPRLIYASISAFDPQGERGNEPGFDALIQAESGFMHMNGESAGPPCKMPVALMDILAAHHLKQAILIALMEREQTGRGRLLNVSLFDAALVSLANQAANFLVAANNPTRMGSEHPNIFPYGTIFTCKDQKEVVLVIGTDLQFQHLCEILNHSEWAKTQEFSTNSKRVSNREQLRPLLSKAILEFEAKTFLNSCRQKNIPASAINDVATALNGPEAKALQLHGSREDGQEILGLSQLAFKVPEWQCPPESPPSFNPE